MDFILCTFSPCISYFWPQIVFISRIQELQKGSRSRNSQDGWDKVVTPLLPVVESILQFLLHWCSRKGGVLGTAVWWQRCCSPRDISWAYSQHKPTWIILYITSKKWENSLQVYDKQNKKNLSMKQWAAGRVGGKEAMWAERFHWGQVAGDWLLLVLEPWHEKWSQASRKAGKNGRVQLDGQREVFVMWSWSRLLPGNGG